MNRIKRIAAATAVSTVVLAPITAGLAFAEPYPGHENTSSISTTKAQIEHEERLQMLQNQRSGAVDGQSASSIGADSAGFPWETVGMAALAGAALPRVAWPLFAVSTTNRVRPDRPDQRGRRGAISTSAPLVMSKHKWRSRTPMCAPRLARPGVPQMGCNGLRNDVAACQWRQWGVPMWPVGSQGTR